MQKSTSILYFDCEGRANLSQVIRVVRRTLRKRPDLQSLKVVVFTSRGEGPALAYSQLQEFDPKIIAITFPPGFSVQRGDVRYYPEIPPKIKEFFKGVGIPVITSRLPFDLIEGAAAHNDQLRLIREVLTLFGGSFSLCVQAVLQACDHGELQVGEKVISITGDAAALVTASTTEKFLSKIDGLVINEVFCKTRNFTLSRKHTSNLEPLGEALPHEKMLESKAVATKALPFPKIEKPDK